MCGFSGILLSEGALNPALPAAALEKIRHRGPDYQDICCTGSLGLAHARLSILDLSHDAHQPFWSDDRRFVMVYNGEIYNFREIRSGLEAEGHIFRTEGDTEVLLKLWISKGESGLQRLNGFFAFAVYDTRTETLVLVRDRFGIKPLFYYQDDSRIAFSSELTALMAYDFDKKTDPVSVFSYLQLNYLPGEESILQGVKKLKPGFCLHFRNRESSLNQWYTPVSSGIQKETLTLKTAAHRLNLLLEDSIRHRLIADVPLGGFLSGGLDSSLICALAARQVKDFRTFSIGFRDDPFHDESHHASAVARHIGSRHTEIRLHSDVIPEAITGILDRLSEPFADSSALAVYILSREVRKEVSVALSGDGADELFGGYYKHSAEWYSRNSRSLRLLSPLMRSAIWFPASRMNRFANLTRQLARLGQGMNKTAADRYWSWCSISQETEAQQLLHPDAMPDMQEYLQRRSEYCRYAATEGRDMNPVLRNDVMLVLPGDMLQKVDLMSMAHALEVRVPFLDHRIVEFASTLPADLKVRGRQRKIILKEAAKVYLPDEIIFRKKHGFEVPLERWLHGPLAYLTEGELFEKNFIESQSLFDFQRIQELKKKLNSGNPGDSAARMWALIVFQYWWKKNR